MRDETVALHIGIDPVPLRSLAALLFLGGIVYALVSGNWGLGAIVFGLGAVVLGLERLRGDRGRPNAPSGGCWCYAVRSSWWTP